MGLFKKSTTDPDQISALKAELVSLRLRIDEAERAKEELFEKVDSVDQHTADINHRLDSVSADADDLGDRVGSMSVEVGKMRNGVADVNHQINTVNAQVSTVNAQVGAVGALGKQVRTLSERLDQLSSSASKPPPPPPAPDNRVDDLIRRVTMLSATVADLDEKESTVDPGVERILGERLDTLLAEVTSLKATVSDLEQQAPDVAAQPAIDPEEESELRAQIEELAAAVTAQSERLESAENEAHVLPAPSVDAQQLATMQSEMSQIAERMAALDRRMTNVSMELANQLTELSSDLDVLLEAGENTTTSEDGEGATVTSVDTTALTSALEAVQASTERLAGEQARYQIQFREDLAELAERLRRPTR